MTEDVRDPFVPLIEALAAFHEPTFAHCQRVGEVAALVAAQVPGLEPELARLAGQLHDVGKLAVDRSGLDPWLPATDEHPPGWLQPHPVVGCQLVGSVPSPYATVVAAAVLDHHERLDGSGYPNHAAGDHLDPLGRIVAVSDVMDALFGLSDRREPERLDEVVLVIQGTVDAWFPVDVLDAVRRTVRDERDHLVAALASSMPYPGPPPAA